jgi:hypothetical protein
MYGPTDEGALVGYHRGIYSQLCQHRAQTCRASRGGKDHDYAMLDGYLQPLAGWGCDLVIASEYRAVDVQRQKPHSSRVGLIGPYE